MQEVTENDELILMYRFFYHMELQRYLKQLHANNECVLSTVDLLTLTCFSNRPGIMHVFCTKTVDSIHNFLNS